MSPRNSYRRPRPTRIPALPFCTATLKSDWRPAGYPIVLSHLGDHIRRRRLELGLLQKNVASQIGTHTQTVCNWEIGDTSPALPWLPGIIRFLGYDPRPVPVTMADRLKHYRTGLGVSRKAMAKRLGVDPGTLCKWERGICEPKKEFLRRVQAEI